ncbi:SCAN domain-containing protein 3-like [Tachypleus tridentatus]|uniref:SCAN domain-containing protein 3-like n=1 Tax=Tachypleus tridentatus TaxID=6853 RepID=UPI003FD53CF0
MIDVTNDGCPILELLGTESSVVEMELIELLEDPDLKMNHKFHSTIEFWEQITEINFNELKKTSVRLISIFSTTYCCESLYSVMKFVKPKHNAVLTNQHLTELIRTALTTYQPEFQRLTTRMETHTTSTSSK